MAVAGQRVGDRLVDGAVVVLATWTPLYHLSLLVGLPAVATAALEAVVLTGCLVAGRRGRATAAARPAPPPDGARTPRPPGAVDAWLIAGSVAAAVVAALGMALSGPWVVVWVSWLVAAGLATWSAVRRLPRRGSVVPEDRAAPSGDRWRRVEPWVAWAWTLGLALMSVSIRRPNPDDLFYLNVAQWVADRGHFPLRDTLFADLTYPMANWPPVASYDGLVGTVGRLTGQPAAAVEYLAVLPLATALSVLALWRLLRAWRTPYVALALSAGLLFLLMDGTESYGSPGNLFLTRLWQGKVILLCLLVPALLTYAARYAEHPSRRRLLWLAAGGAASVGLTTTALFVVPVIAVAAAAPLLRTAPRRAGAAFVAMAGYPLVGAAVTLALGGRSADDFGERRLYRFDAEWIGHLVMLTGVVAFVGVLAVLLGALLVPSAPARVTTGVLAGVFGVVLVPGVTDAAYRLIGLGPTLWRLSFGLTVGALVGLATARLWEALSRSRTTSSVVVPSAVVSAGLALVVAFGHPVWSSDTTSSWQAPFHWQRSPAARAAADAAIAEAGPGGLVLAPDNLSVTIAVTTTEVKTVAPRDYYMHYLRDDPRFRYAERATLVALADAAVPGEQADVERALGVLGVDVGCAATSNGPAFVALQRAGYRLFFESDHYRCLSRG